MINIKIVCVGNLKEEFWRKACEEYKKRLSRFCNLKIVELDEQNRFDNTQRIVEEEGRGILNHVDGSAFLLDIKGKEMSSEEIAEKIKNETLVSSEITFVIGGSYGVSNDVRDKIKNKLSFGKITLPHNLARVVLLEQIYRAFMINSGSKYHK
jgi:23S rRNA (pseudouridine1915-N3)-methyltransferase